MEKEIERINLERYEIKRQLRKLYYFYYNSIRAKVINKVKYAQPAYIGFVLVKYPSREKLSALLNPN